MTPFISFPPEVTSHIFCFTLANFVLQEVEKFHQPLIIFTEAGALTLGAVCQLWRQIAWSTPQLWSDVMLTLASPLTYNKINVIQEWLARSRQLPLSIWLNIAHQFDIYVDKILTSESEKFQIFADVFNMHSARWQTLSLQCLNWFSGSFTGNLHGALLLKTLQIIVWCQDRLWAEFKAVGPKPQPERVFSVGYPHLKYIGISWSNATHITVGYLWLADCI